MSDDQSRTTPDAAEIAQSLSPEARRAVVDEKIVGLKLLGELIALIDGREWNDLGRAVREEVLLMPDHQPKAQLFVSGVRGVVIQAAVKCRRCGHTESIETRDDVSATACPKCGGGLQISHVRIG